MCHQTYGYLPSCKASPPIGWYQIILLGDRGTCVNNLPRVALDSGAAGIRTRDLLIASPAPTAMPQSNTHYINLINLILKSHFTRLSLHNKVAHNIERSHVYRMLLQVVGMLPAASVLLAPVICWRNLPKQRRASVDRSELIILTVFWQSLFVLMLLFHEGYDDMIQYDKML